MEPPLKKQDEKSILDKASIIKDGIISGISVFIMFNVVIRALESGMWVAFNIMLMLGAIFAGGFYLNNFFRQIGLKN